ncbi:HAD family hydrolase [Pseudoalteromonas piscicida]|uniref:HAD family hydrolase n=1 Tax=Pseudoalteromonas piscicida TaxID=43662 RepID=UPI0027E3D722|nr:HAD family hydrolase [Pseudoalteromonas piscicida]WMO14773.1 haloacid dehalogenase-like hydrolase [Pseudoalteromonas piscicida]
MRSIIVCDFDGTLITKNSFPLWVKFLLKESLFDLNIRLFFSLIFLLVKRKLFRQTHSDFKRSLMLLNLNEDYNKRFVLTLNKYVNCDVIDNLCDCDNDTSIVISTAAPSNYAKYLDFILPVEIDKVFCSEICEGKFFENYAQAKVDSLYSYYGYAFNITAYTDHHEDIPLLLASHKAFLVNPSKESLIELSKVNIDYTLI